MSINHAHLRAFNAVATHGSYTRAAEVLHVSQPTLSAHVKELEERYSVKLFERRGRGVVLTDFGRSVLDITERLFRIETEVEELLISARELVTGQLRVGADSPYHIIPIMAAFQGRYPGIQLSISFGNSEQLLKSLLSSKCDIAVLPNVPGDDRRLSSVPLKPDRLVVFVNQSHAWARRSSIRLQELKDERLVLRESGSNTRALFVKAMREMHIPINDVMEIGSREGVREAVAAGLGVGVVSESEFGCDNRLHALGVSDARLEDVEFVVCLKERRPMRVIRAFFDLLEKFTPA
jgi:aminoethylphosphonate catabolism LysR family transcriptional regulator